ncbi:hypothetical protein [Tsukamurella tyrosinosolvens]|uniref:hypothetical protein n=1 Tax=Tsukamurella tyrosinosolvens TaxID=57704 RepID=UPI000C7F704A|nr:hypothetical protein [Tsukamurella tyrosinosolvens]AUN42562.1 hypothetical protein ASU32_23145 [Tsukamurella tyrosinosolvens]
MASPSDPPTGRVGDTEQFPVARTGAHAAQPSDAAPAVGPAHAVGSDSGSGITRGGWCAITIAAAVLLILGFLLTFGPARYWTPAPVVFLGYFLISGLIGLAFWKGVRELRDSNPTLHSGDGPASPGARVAAAIGAVGIASALVLLPAGLTDAPANAAPCPDGTNTCGPQPTMGPQPTQGNGGNTTAPQAPNTTVPGYTAPDTPPQQGNGSTPTVQGQVPTMPTGESPSSGCIFNCGPTQAPQQVPQTGQANPPQTGQNPVTTAPNTPATTPQAPTTTPRLRTPTPETTTSTTSSKARDRDDGQQRSSNENRDKNSGTPYQTAEIAALAGTYRRRKTSDAVRYGQVVSEDVTRTMYTNATAVSKPMQGPLPTWTPEELPAALLEPSPGVYNDNPGVYGSQTGLPSKAAIPAQRLQGQAAMAYFETQDQFVASALLNHYLKNTGTSFELPERDVEKFVSDSTNGYGDSSSAPKVAVQQTLEAYLEMARKAAAANGKTTVSEFRSPWIPVAGSDGDSVRSLGHFNLQVIGAIKMDPDGTYSMKYYTAVRDWYNFKPHDPWSGVAEHVSNAMQNLYTAGEAKDFRVDGETNVHEVSGKLG